MENRIPVISNQQIKLASIERLKLRLEDSEDIRIASADALGFFIGAEWYREQLELKTNADSVTVNQ
jgi:hypothetical protein